MASSKMSSTSKSRLPSKTTRASAVPQTSAKASLRSWKSASLYGAANEVAADCRIVRDGVSRRLCPRESQLRQGSRIWPQVHCCALCERYRHLVVRHDGTDERRYG